MTAQRQQENLHLFVCVSVCLLPSVGDVASSAVVQRSKMEVALEGSAGTFNIIRLNLR